MLKIFQKRHEQEENFNVQTTLTEFKQIEKDPAFDCRFQPFFVLIDKASLSKVLNVERSFAHELGKNLLIFKKKK